MIYFLIDVLLLHCAGAVPESVSGPDTRSI